MAANAVPPTRRRNPLIAWLAADTVAGIKRQRMLLGYLFIFPTLIGLAVFIVYPMAYSFWLSFHKWSVFLPTQYIGTDNYDRLFHDKRVFTAYKNTFTLVIMTVTMLEVMAMMLALAVKRVAKGVIGYFFRTVYFFPVLLSGAAVAVTLSYMFHQDFGVINYYLGFLGIKKVPWLNSSKTVLWAISLTTVWRNLGFSFIIYLGGVSAMPSEVLEAADVDGAKGFRKLWSIIIPLLSPTILFATVTDMIKMLQFFDEPYIMTRGGPGDASRTVVMMMYESAFANFQMGYASSIAFSLFLVILAITALQFVLSRRWVFYG